MNGIDVEPAELRRQLDETRQQLLQSEKLAAIGQLAAGVAHEINNPVGYIHSNLATLRDYLDGVVRLLALYGEAEPLLAGQEAFLTRLATLKQEVDLDYLLGDIENLLAETNQGVERVKRIVSDLKDFSRVDDTQWESADITRCLETTLNVVWNELKYKAEVVREYAALPLIHCIPSQLNQVFMNLFINAAQAIDGWGTITVRTLTPEEGWVRVDVSDTGGGISPENQARIFEAFFTTKPVGRGTGLGLSISKQIVDRHQGRIEVESAPGQGTIFRVWLPVAPRQDG